MITDNVITFRRLQACAELIARLCFFNDGFSYVNALKSFQPRYTIYGGNYLKIQESAENYLETILMLSEKQPYVRSIDIATELGFSKPSVSENVSGRKVHQQENVSEK